MVGVSSFIGKTSLQAVDCLLPRLPADRTPVYWGCPRGTPTRSRRRALARGRGPNGIEPDVSQRPPLWLVARSSTDRSGDLLEVGALNPLGRLTGAHASA